MDLSRERQGQILKQLDNYGRVSVEALARELKVTAATIRRDLIALEQENKLQRVHGGAIKISFIAEEPAIVERRSLYGAEKNKIAQLAAKRVRDQMSIYLDVGTTAARMVPYLKSKRNLQILTNSVEASLELIKMVNQKVFHGKIILIGGELNALQLSVSGPISQAFTNQFFVDMAFIGVGGVHLTGGLTGYDEKEVLLSRQILLNAKEAVALLDHSKIGVRNLYKIADLHEVDMIVCDEKYPAEWEKHLKETGIEWIYR